ncbi:hypothetical protein OXX79_006104 [Metschnikowia pulcherrima]
MSAVFRDTRFLVIDGGAEAAELEDGLTISQIKVLITENGGVCETRTRSASSGATEKLRIHHIITRTTDFAEFAAASDLMIPITTPQWLTDSVSQGQKRNYRLYMPEPVPFMDKVVLCIADNVAQGDKEIMYAGVRAFGGQFLDALSRYTTHLVAMDLSNNKSVVAANIRKKESLEVKIVLPHWVDACMRQQRHVPEEPYLLTNPAVLSSGKPDFSQAPPESQNSLEDHESSRASILAGKRVFVAADYYLSEHLRASVHALITSCGGVVQTKYNREEIDVYLCKFRAGPQFKACCADPAVEVASLQWLYHIVMRGAYSSPLQSNMLLFPVPEAGIPQFQSLRISITGISGDARHYLATLIAAMGATFTKTLDCNNNFLVCAQLSGEKYQAAKMRWLDVRIVNYMWIEDCFAAWSYLDPSLARYTSFGAKTRILGRAHLTQSDVDKWLVDENASDVGDSMHEGTDLDIVPNATPQPPSSPKLPSLDPKSAQTTQDVSQTAKGTQGKSQSAEIFSQDPPAFVDTTNFSSPMVNGRTGRSAKAKASLKLHSDMEDLNQYTSMSKSSRKMKTYMEQLEKTATPTKKKKEEVIDIVAAEEPQPKKQKVVKEVHLVAIMTGCESILTLNKVDTAKLSKIGIQVVTDYNSKKHIDTIIAPKVLRTEKFLKSLSKAKRIVHPTYLSDILGRSSLATLTWEDLCREFNIDHYSLDKVVPIKQINNDLDVSGKSSGLVRLLSQDVDPVFSGLSLNLSSNLNGGADLISSILREHGLTASKTVKVTAGTRKSGLLSMEDDTTILVAHKSKDKKAVAGLEGVTVVEWEWCVKSIFHKKLQSYSDYII